MKEKEAREVAGLLDLVDDLVSLREALAKKGRDFHICAQDKEECLHSSMSLPAESGLIFVDGAIQELWNRLGKYGVTPDAAPASA